MQFVIRYMADDTPFRRCYKYFRKKNHSPDYSCVVDFDVNDETSNTPIVQKLVQYNHTDDDCLHCKNLGLVNHKLWSIYLFTNKDGLYVIRNPFLDSGQQFWIRKCFESYPRKPAVTNLDAHFSGVDDIWNLRKSEDIQKRSYMRKLSWCTLGYHYNWDAKTYSKSHRSEFPSCLKTLSQHIAHCVGFKQYEPESAIVNYYNMKSSLNIHNDHSELDHDAPICSLSFGQAGIFLIGTKNKDEAPISMFLRSGDIVIMSGESRLAYHAVPSIVQDNVNYGEAENQSNWLEFLEYINKMRINISVRQVFPVNKENHVSN